jgi:two-component system response regulator QseB
MHQQDPGRNLRNAPAGDPSKAKLIVVVDNDPRNRSFLSRALRPTFRVAIADSAAAALRLLDFAPKALLAEWQLADVEGPQLIAAARAKLPRLPVVVFTSDPCFETAQAVVPYAYALLRKHASVSEIVTALHDAIGQSTEAPATLGSLRFEMARAAVIGPSGEVSLTRAESCVLAQLWSRAGVLVSTREIARVATGVTPRSREHAGSVARRYVHQLRLKLGDALIETDRQRGYRLRVPQRQP